MNRNEERQFLKRFKEDNNLTNEQLSMLTGLSVSTISRFLNGKNRISEELYQKISIAVNNLCVEVEKQILAVEKPEKKFTVIDEIADIQIVTTSGKKYVAVGNQLSKDNKNGQLQLNVTLKQL